MTDTVSCSTDRCRYYYTCHPQVLEPKFHLLNQTTNFHYFQLFLCDEYTVKLPGDTYLAHHLEVCYRNNHTVALTVAPHFSTQFLHSSIAPHHTTYSSLWFIFILSTSLCLGIPSAVFHYSCLAEHSYVLHLPIACYMLFIYSKDCTHRG